MGSRSSMAGLGCSQARWAWLGARARRAAGPVRRGKACRRAVGRLREVLGADASARRTPVRLGGSARGAGGPGVRTRRGCAWVSSARQREW
jgi:hypothetical protein